MIKLYS